MISQAKREEERILSRELCGTGPSLLVLTLCDPGLPFSFHALKRATETSLESKWTKLSTETVS